MNIEEIKKRIKSKYGAIPDGISDSRVHLQATIDAEFLLSIIEQADHALWRISTLNIPAPMSEFKTESEAFQAFAIQTLQNIRGEQ